MRCTKILSAFLAIASLLLGAFTPMVLAQEAVEVSNNGAGSTNTTNLTENRTVTVVQSNTATVVNTINANATSGGNNLNDNTGGNIGVNTGSATVNVQTNTLVNANVAKTDCQICPTCTSVEISGNGSESVSTANLITNSEVMTFQENHARIANQINANSISGQNNTNRNTNGEVSVLTGPATVNAEVYNTANANLLQIGGDSGTDDEVAAIEITGNGSHSQNAVNLFRQRAISIVQNNLADMNNRLDTNAISGQNSAEDNTRGSVGLRTGSATVNAKIDNLANFNYAEAECCEGLAMAEVSGNGADSRNTFNQTTARDLLSVFQNDEGGLFSATNVANASPLSGSNRLNRNTGSEENSDPVTALTGPATSNVEVYTTGGANVYTAGGNWSWSNNPWFEFEFDFGSVWNHLF